MKTYIHLPDYTTNDTYTKSFARTWRKHVHIKKEKKLLRTLNPLLRYGGKVSHHKSHKKVATDGKSVAPLQWNLTAHSTWTGRLKTCVFSILFSKFFTSLKSRDNKPVNMPVSLTFIGQCIVIYSYSTTNKMNLLSQIIYSCKTLYMFWTVFPFIIRSSKLRIQQRYMSNILLLYTQFWAPDDDMIYI